MKTFFTVFFILVLVVMASVQRNSSRGRKKKKLTPLPVSSKYPPVYVKCDDRKLVRVAHDEYIKLKGTKNRFGPKGIALWSAWHLRKYNLGASGVSSTSAEAGHIQTNTAVASVIAEAVQAIATGKLEGVSFYSNIHAWANFENWLLCFMEENPFSKRVIKWSTGEDEDLSIGVDDGLGPLIATYVRWYTSPGGSVIGQGPNAITGARGAGYPTVKAISAAVRNVFPSEQQTPFTTFEPLKKMVSSLRKRHTTKNPARPYNLGRYFPLIYNAITNECGFNENMQLEVYCMHLIALQHGNRGSSFAQYCPELPNIFMPCPEAYPDLYSSDGVPWAIAIGYTMWKGRSTTESGVADIKWLLLFRNDQSSIRCAVTVFFLYARRVRLLDQTKGPIFGELDKNGLLKASHTKKELATKPTDLAGAPTSLWYTQEGELVNFSSKRIGEIAACFFDAVGLFECTWHTHRVMMTVIAASQGKDLYDVIHIGGWSMSESAEWMRYFTLGQRIYIVHRDKDQCLPVSMIYPVPSYSADPLKHGIDPSNDWIRVSDGASRSISF